MGSCEHNDAARHAVDALDMFVTRRIHDRKALDHLSGQEAMEVAELAEPVDATDLKSPAWTLLKTIP